MSPNKILVRRSKEQEHGSVLVSGQVDRRSGKGGGQKKRFRHCLKPHCPEKLLYLRAIQGHSGKEYSGNARINPALQDNVLLPEDFTKFIHHVGHAEDLGSVVRNGQVPGGFSTRTGRQAVFFTCEDPMDDDQGFRKTFGDLSKARIAPYKNTWKPLQDMVFWCNLMLAQEGGLRFYKVTCGRPLRHTACRVH